ncbi:hypothetical protein OsJ_35362 [Oryza sativa Japonica Group]|uniref:Amidase domain-containing protein n=1 Tax=Oryza sativa subsp. japonica TaxID=39947 RepID=B9GC26_ORYSJ|nr:hypothetical protein OsJ_35362 [Oryza sativa Japonica Group]
MAAKVYKPAAEVNLGPDSDEFYISPNVKAPRVAGLLVKIFVWILEMPIIGSMVLYILKKDNLINKLVQDAEIPEPPLFTSTHSWEDIPEQNVCLTKPDLSPPERVQEAVSCLPASLESTLAGSPPSSPKRWTIRDFNRAYSSGEVTPVQVAKRFLAAVKECSGPGLNMAFFISYSPEDIIRQAEESTLRYQRGTPLSAMDGILVAVKDEIDCLPYPTTGSVRMPAALCGVVGFKPTAGRLSNAGVLPLNWTVGMPGILAGTVEDAAVAYSAIVDQSQPSYLRPELNLPLLKSSLSIKNIKLAKYAKWFNDSSEDIRSCCDKSLQMLHAHYGWETLDVTIPEIEEMRLAHYVTIGSECTASLAKYLDKLKRSEIGWDVRVALGVYGSFSSRAYLNSQRLRNRQMYFHKEIFKTADVIVSPMTGVTAYKLQDDALKSGELDYINGAALVRYSIAGNFLGLPAITVMEACKKHYKKPEVFYDLLKKD